MQSDASVITNAEGQRFDYTYIYKRVQRQRRVAAREMGISQSRRTYTENQDFNPKKSLKHLAVLNLFAFMQISRLRKSGD